MPVYQIANRAFEQNDRSMPSVKALALKDFERLGKLLQLDFPELNIVFDYKNFDDLNLAVQLHLDTTRGSEVLEYLKANYYEVTPVGGGSDPLLKINALSLALKEKTIFLYEDEICVFERFGKKYRGYIDETPGQPGLHWDFEKIIYSVADREKEMSTIDFPLDANKGIYDEIIKMGANWKYDMFESRSFVGALPPTNFYEGDVVTIKDPSHPRYVANQQFAVFRIDWQADPLVYKVKLDKENIFDVKASQLQLVEKGVTRLYYAGSVPKYWKDLKTEAEFYLLLGLFEYHYNSDRDSYSWTIPEAKDAISEHRGDAILRWKKQIFLISYLTPEDLTFDPRLVAEAALNDDLVLSL